MNETYAPAIRYPRAKELGELEELFKLYPHLASRENAMKVLRGNLARPIQLLCKSVI
ncbi:hypothetical protein BKA70DRAFT_1363321 [Coprinopsis sp. MPI-PUGE-AT-0042]|nr:hypothetical protein BKA70DRAFT_1363321 [Coprinopsis sp. MPI-PUGE-AT-0042]